MNADEIVSALRCCNRSKGHRCSECPVFSRYEHRICKATVDRFAAELIESLQAQVDEMAILSHAADKIIAKQNREIESLQAELNDVVPVVRGEWVTTRTIIHDGEPYCSLCGQEALAEYGRHTYIKSKYCPNCGEKMESEGKDE